MRIGGHMRQAVAVPSKWLVMRIFIVDDDPEILRDTHDMIAAMGHEPRTFSAAKEALAALSSELPEVVLLDILMPEMDGIELIRAARASYPELTLIAMSGGSERVSAALGLKASEALGANAIMQKPFRLDTLREVIAQAARDRAAQ